ncbi:MAG: glycosyltransferase [Pseudomonadota bacterium]|nr:glycosyltransferase [Pseudomonadota bacterium]
MSWQRRLATVRKLVRDYTRWHGGGIKGLSALIGRSAYYLVRLGPRGLVQRARVFYAVNRGAPAPLVDIRGGSRSTLLSWDIVPHQESVDIIVCVHNALEDVRRCLSSVLRYSFPPYRLVLVDDGSGAPTRDYLQTFATAQGAVLLRNEAAKGYTLAANQGLRASKADYAVLLNSDTVVTESWLDRLLMCPRSDPRVGLVGPLSNTASWQSVPEVMVDGDWAENALPPGLTVDHMSSLLAAASGRVYPRIGFLNGFCLLIRRQVIEELGLFDEPNFGAGYGEENDYCLRAHQAGWSLAVADDVYIFHAQSRSYSNERRLALSRQADKNLAQKHGQDAILANLVSCKSDLVLEGVRARARAALLRAERVEAGRRRWEGKRVSILLPITEPGGGANVLVNEARAMERMGVSVRFVNRAGNRPFFERAYSDLGFPVDYVESPDDVAKVCEDTDAVMATVYSTVRWLLALARNDEADPILAYYVQDFEPDFFAPGSRERREASASYSLVPDLVRVTKTEWNRLKLLKETGRDALVVGPSCDIDLFRPRYSNEHRWPRGPLRVAAMVRPSTPRRAPELTLKVLEEVERLLGDEIEVRLFGVNPEDPDYRALVGGSRWRNEGVLGGGELAALFNACDLFVDFSVFQAMGLTALEAMSSGVAVIVPEQGGATSFVTHEHNALVVDSSDQDACASALVRLLTDHELRARLQRQGLADIASYAPEHAAFRLLDALFTQQEGV